jgi:hypothetical protein
MTVILLPPARRARRRVFALDAILFDFLNFKVDRRQKRWGCCVSRSVIRRGRSHTRKRAFLLPSGMFHFTLAVIVTGSLRSPRLFGNVAMKNKTAWLQRSYGMKV